MLIAVVAAVMIGSLIIFATMSMQVMDRKLGKQVTIGATLAKIDTALANFVSQHRRLPCPANGAIASDALNAGIETLDPVSGTCTLTNQRNGVVPWVTLGLAEADGADPWSGRVSYRVPPGLAGTVPRSMDMSWCDPAGATTGGAKLSCQPSCTGSACTNPDNFLYAKGLQVQGAGAAWLNRPSPPWPGAPASAPPASSGAAYVLISHGPTGAGAFNSGGILQPGTALVGTNEVPNRADQPLGGATIFKDLVIETAASAAHFDDYLSHPTIGAVLVKANLAARTLH